MTIEEQLRAAYINKTLSTTMPPLSFKRRMDLVRRVIEALSPEVLRTPLLAMRCNERQQTYPLRDGLTVGSGQDCDVVLQSPYVSSFHCLFERMRDNWLVVDMGSTNGVYVNGERFGKRILKDGDVIGLGSLMLVFLEGEAEQS